MWIGQEVDVTVSLLWCLQGAKKFAVILAFDVPVTREAKELAESMGVRIFTADIIYHLFDQFSAYLKHVSMLYVLLIPPSTMTSSTAIAPSCRDTLVKRRGAASLCRPACMM